MTSYAYFVATCREEHKKKHPGAAVAFTEFSKKCSERWKVSWHQPRDYEKVSWRLLTAFELFQFFCDGLPYYLIK